MVGVRPASSADIAMMQDMKGPPKKEDFQRAG